MRRFVEGLDRGLSALLPDCPEDGVGEDNPLRVVDVFVDELDLGGPASPTSAPPDPWPQPASTRATSGHTVSPRSISRSS